MSYFEIEGVVNATIALVKEKIKARWGSLEDCCTDANYMIYEALKDGVELPTETFIPDLERVQGVIRVNGEEIPHEWIRICDVEYDAAREWFGDADVEYDGEVVDW
jgi:hypothetical protein